MFLLLIILIFLWLQIVATTLPLFPIGLFVMLILNSKNQNAPVFVLAFLGGLIIDVSSVRYLGGTSLFLTGWLFLILMYERKYEIDTIPFVMVSSFFGTFLYLWFFGYGDIFVQSIAGSFFGVVFFVLFRFIATFHQEKLQFHSL
jgi:hypothetical protein